jgi:hypothetical protein
MNITALRPLAIASRMTPLGRWLAVLASLATLAALQASLFPRWPRARPLPQQKLLASVQLVDPKASQVSLPAKERQPSRTHDLAISEAMAIRFSNGEELRLLRGVARERKKLEIQSFTATRPELKLLRSTLGGPPPRAAGTIQQRPALQTCLVAANPKALGFGVNETQLTTLVDQASRGREAEIRRILGLQANRDYSCVLISLRSASAAPVSMARWNQLLTILPGALLPQASKEAAPANRASS